jgi:hypothetical protein
VSRVLEARAAATPGRRAVALPALLFATLAVAALYAACARITGGDLWWHLASGRWIVEQGRVPRHDVFSWTADGAVWHNQEWLAQVALYAAFRTLGGDGLATLKVAVAVALFVLAVWIGWRRSGSLAAAVLVAVPSAVVCHTYLDIRPQLLGFLLLLVLMALLDAYRRGARMPAPVVFPALFLVWANTHSSFVYGLGVLGLFAGAEVTKSRFRLPADPLPMARARRLVPATALAALACLVSPRPLDAFVFPLQILGAGHAVWRTSIVEWLPAVLFRDADFNPALFGWLLVGHTALAVAAVATDRRRFDLTDLAQVAVTAAMALGARRFVPLFALVAIPFGARSLALVAARVPAPARDAAFGVAALVALASVGRLLIVDLRGTYRNGLFTDMVNEVYFPRLAADFLRLNPLPARLYSLYGWGGYLMYQVPGQKVFIDGRAHMVYPEALYREQWIGEGGDPGWRAMLDRHGVSLVLWPTEAFAGGRHKVLARALRETPGWVLVYEDNQAAVYAHAERAREWVAAYRALTLRYPDTARAQLFLANAYLQANRFDEAREHLRAVVRRYPDTAQMTALAEQRLAQAAQSGDQAAAWFGVGFYREVRDDVAGAVEAYRRALDRGLAGSPGEYASAVLSRLGGAPRAGG